MRAHSRSRGSLWTTRATHASQPRGPSSQARVHTPRKLAERAEERKVQASSHGVRAETAGQRDVGFELGAVALHFLVEEGLQATALVAARFEADHPPGPFAFYELSA